MPLLEFTDFSGGMVTSVGDTNVPANSMKTLENVDAWTSSGDLRLIKNIVLHATFPTGEVYDHHIIYPIYGVGEYAIIMMQSGKLYAFDGTSFSLIGTFTAGSKILYAAGSIYLYYRPITSPSATNIERKIIYWDYSSSSWQVKDAVIKPQLSIASANLITNGISNSDVFYKAKILSSTYDGGLDYGLDDNQKMTNGQDYILLLNKTTDFEKGHLFLQFKTNYTDPDADEQYVCTFDKTSGLIPFASGEVRKLSANTFEIVYEDSIGTSIATALTWILGQYTAGAKNYIRPGSRVIINGKESTIQSITKNSPPPEGTYDIVLNDSIVPDFSQNAYDASQFTVIWIEVFWDTDFPLPIQKRYSDILESRISDVRKPYKLTSGVGTYAAVSSGRMFIVNPYFPNVQGGKSEDKKGLISWSEPNGFGELAYSFIPYANSSSIGNIASEVTGMTTISDTVIVFFKNAIARISYNDFIQILQTEAIGMWRDYNYYVHEGMLFLFSGRAVYVLFIDNNSYQTGKLSFEDLSSQIRTLFLNKQSNYDARLYYDSQEKLLYVVDKLNSFSLICSLKTGKPVWTKFSYGQTMFGGFNINGDSFFIMKDADYEIWKYSYDASGNPNYLTSPITIESHNIYMPEGRYFLRDIEVVYVNNGTGLTLSVYGDDSLIKSFTLPARTTIGRQELKFAISSKLRLNKLKWQITGTPSSDFRLSAVYINYDIYSPESRRGY